MSLKRLMTHIDDMVRFAPMKEYAWAEKIGGLFKIIGSELYATKNEMSAIEGNRFHSRICWKTGKIRQQLKMVARMAETEYEDR